jgi:SAM-dependent methyltransferase
MSSRRGYEVTGVDLSDAMLQRARGKAEREGQSVRFLQHDARELPFNGEFDVVIMLCEGGFPLMETDEMNFEILKNVTSSLKNRGRFIFTTLNGLFPLYHSMEDFHESTKKEGSAGYISRTFDLMTFRDHNVTTFEDDDGNVIHLDCNERYYVPSEITWLLKSLGYNDIGIYGAKLGAFSRGDKLTTADFEMLVTAVKG